LQTTIVFKNFFKQIQINIEKNVKNIITNKKVEKRLHNNIFE